VPLYDYDCAACGTRFEVVHGVHADGPAACPACGGGPVRKAFAPPAIHFKGSGWAKKERRATSASTRAGKADDTAGSGSTADATPAGASAPSDGASPSPTTSPAGPATSGPAAD
jgi:putative FmdB family regulatory protein